LIVGVAEVAAVSAAAAFSVIVYRRYFAAHKILRPRFSAKLLSEGAPIGLSQMFWVVKMYGATLIFGLVATAQETGYFAGAMRIYIALHTFVWLYYFNLLPSLARAWQKGRDEFSALVSNSMRLVTVLSALGGAVWIYFAPMVMRAAYGQEFAGGAGALGWLAGACVAAALSGHYRFGLIAAGFQKKEMAASAAGAFLAAALIPAGYLYWGVSGAGAALCAAEWLVLLFTYLAARKLLFGEGSDEAESKKNYLESVPEATR
jgi:O-antigen/teichoic acid export membrane protein